MKKHLSFFAKAKAGIAAHKTLTAIIVLTVLIGGYEIVSAKATEASVVPQYTLTAAHLGDLQQTVSGTGQVSASNQTDITSQVSGTIESIDASVGQSVKEGQLLATIDPTNALTSLDSAQLSLAKLTEPVKETDLSNAQDSVTQAYSSAFSSVSSAFLDLPTIMSGLNDMLYSSDGFLADQHKTYLSQTAQNYRDTAGTAYDAAAAQYYVALAEFKGLDRTSATSSLDQLFADTYKTMQMVSDAATKSQTAVAYILANEPDYDAKSDSTADSTANTLASQASSDTSAILSAENSITSATNSLDTLVGGPDAYDLQSAQTTVDDAERTYQEYFIRAPYDGIIGRIPVNVYGQAGGSTVIATIVGQQKIASISLNEVDAAKVAVGQNVNITFDAIDGLEATGTVSEVDQVGTVTSGVVSYGVKITINTQDARIKPGMSVNTTIITKEEDNVLLVPSSAVKTVGNRSYVQVLPASTTASASAASGAGANLTASGTRRLGGRTASTTATGGYAGYAGANGFASSTRAYGTGSTTRSFSGSFGGAGAAGATAARTTTVSTTAAPQNIFVTVGDSDDTNTMIVTGLTPGQLIVTGVRTGGGTAAAGAAPSLLQSLGGGRAGAAGAGAGAGAARFGGGGGGAAAGAALRGGATTGR